MSADPSPEDATSGGGWLLIDGWARGTLAPTGPRLWQTLTHKSACLSRARGTGGQNGGFRDEMGEPSRRCLKSVEAIGAEPRRLNTADRYLLCRLDRPLILREGSAHYEPIGWDEVHALTAEAFRGPPPERVASYSSGRSSNEAAYPPRPPLRALGSNNLADCSDLCHSPSTVGLSQAFGGGTSMVNLESPQRADGVVLVGSNAPANHPRLMNELIRPWERGGTMPIRGHSNVRGFGSMGVTVRLREPMRLALERLLGKPLSRVSGYDTRALIEAADRGEVDTLLCIGGNLYVANPYSGQAQRALGGIDTLTYLSTKPNTGHFHGLGSRQSLVLPVFNRFETPHRTTVESGNNWVRLNEPGTTHLRGGQLISEVEFLAELPHRIHDDTPIDWRRLRDPVYARELIARTGPGYEGIDASHREFEVSGRVFAEPRSATPSGRAQLGVTPLPELGLPGADHFGGLAPGEPGLVLSLITARGYGQHNTVVYKKGDSHRGMPHRHTILMNPSEIAASGMAAHQRVRGQ